MPVARRVDYGTHGVVRYRRTPRMGARSGGSERDAVGGGQPRTSTRKRAQPHAITLTTTSRAAEHKTSVKLVSPA